MDDGRFHEGGQCHGGDDEYHSHGNASIDDALVRVGKQTVPIEPQGNFGNILRAILPLRPLYRVPSDRIGRREVFNDEITEVVPSYDGRNRSQFTLTE